MGIIRYNGGLEYINENEKLTTEIMSGRLGLT